MSAVRCCALQWQETLTVQAEEELRIWGPVDGGTDPGIAL